ncbi:MAG TPA: hypothetical protein VFM09_01940 [Marmoricola sp.]|nr:hypothetical protein [Marmoricola sp.]
MVQATCHHQDRMRHIVDDWSTAMAARDGWLGGTYGFTEDGRFVGVVRYESAAAREELMRDEASKAGWEAALACCEGDLETHQSEDVTMMLRGGSDDAGFVQVMRGHIGESDRFAHLASDEMTSMLHEARPEIIGATMAIEPDGTFVETIAFTDEPSARRGEHQDMPADVREDLQHAFLDVEYLDLHQPWFASHR